MSLFAPIYRKGQVAAIPYRIRLVGADPCGCPVFCLHVAGDYVGSSLQCLAGDEGHRLQHILLTSLGEHPAQFFYIREGFFILTDNPGFDSPPTQRTVLA
ncbi:hypothetical protein ANRL4_04369 [Anaerolineae bacterium]|nr:hypothetical protein ANRL4_04369 [Anaerolineae bacterium]